VTLGTWHSYKHATFLLWKAGAFDFWVPLHLVLFPNCNVYKEMRLRKCVWWFNLLRVSYASWRQDLKDVIEELDETDVVFNHMVNLRAMMEFFIPVVSDGAYVYGCCGLTFVHILVRVA
jgi:hypothetical protein